VEADGAIVGRFDGWVVTGAFDGLMDGSIDGDAEGAAVAGGCVGTCVVGNSVGVMVGLLLALQSIEHKFGVEAKFTSIMDHDLIRSNPFSKLSETKIEDPVWLWKTQRISLKMNPVSNVKPLSPTYWVLNPVILE